MTHRLPALTVVSTFFLIMLGVLVVGFDAGLACSDWPLCNGRIIPPLEGIILVEMTHRIFSSVTGLLILWNAWVLWRKFPHDPQIKSMAAATVVLLVSVGVMGGVNVLNQLPSGFTTMDMGLAMLLLATLVVLKVLVDERRQSGFFKERSGNTKDLAKLYKPTVVAVTAIMLETMLGGFFKHSSAAHTYVNPNSPLPNELITSFPVAEALFYSHMMAAVLVVMAVLWMFVYTRKYKFFLKESLSLLALTAVQGGLGFLSLITKLELLTTTAHMGVTGLMVWMSVQAAATVKFAIEKSSMTNSESSSYTSGRTVISNG